MNTPNRIMILDDDTQIVDVLGLVLSTAGYEAILETSGEDIEEKIKKTKPDLLIMDIRLLEYDGLKIAHSLKTNAELSNIPIILISARMGDLTQEQIPWTDVIYESKPFRMQKLLDDITS